MKIRTAILLSLVLIQSVSAAPGVDLRILIDTSGSMRQTDPLNLRIPALRLVVGLLPPGSKAAVYTFDQKITPIIPLGEVNTAWQLKARRAAERINSRGLFTDIGAALEYSLNGWELPSADSQRKILLMTDGMVDISKDPTVNAAARERVLYQTLDMVRASQASIYTIALSEQADHDLLQRFSRETNGWAEQVADSGLLQRMFLRIFNQAVQRDSLPLKDNRFIVDGSVQEMTLVVFRRPGSTATALIAPDSTRYTRESPPSLGRWAGEQDYDMITVEKPAAGAWQVQADTDPDNRVMVVTNLNLEMDPVPPLALIGEHLDLTARLRENGNIVTDPTFLKLINFNVTRKGDNDDHDQRPLRDDGVTPDAASGDGVFSTSLDDLLRPGPQQLQITVEGATFQRELQYSINLYPAGVETTLQNGETGQPQSILVRPIPEVVDPASLAITATLTTPEGLVQPLTLIRTPENTWSAQLPQAEGRQMIMFQARGRTPQGRPLSFIPAPITFGNPLALPVASPKAPESPPHDEPQSHDEPQAPPPQEETPSDSAGSSSIILGAIIIAANALLVVGIWFGIRWWRRRNDSLYADLTEQIEPPNITL